MWGLNFEGGRTRVGTVTYQRKEKLRFHLNEYNSKEEVLNAIAFDQDGSLGTFTSSAITVMIDDMFKSRRGDRTGVDNVGLVITDGRSNIQERNTITEADRAKDDDILMMAVGVGKRVGTEEINGIASNPSSDNAFFMEDESELNRIADRILDQLCDS